MQATASKFETIELGKAAEGCVTAEGEGKGRSQRWQTLLILLNTINHVLVLLVSGYLVYLFRDLTNVTSLHALLCTIGYVLFMTEAIITFTDENLWSRYLTRRSTKHVHWILQVLGAVLSLAGVIIKFMDRKRHFQTIHSMLGIASLSTISVMFISGLPVFFAVKLRNVIRPVMGKFIHNFLGISCFVIGMVAQCYGYQKGFIKRRVAAEVTLVLTVTTAMIAFFSLLGPISSLFRQVRSLARCN